MLIRYLLGTLGETFTSLFGFLYTRDDIFLSEKQTITRDIIACSLELSIIGRFYNCNCSSTIIVIHWSTLQMVQLVALLILNNNYKTNIKRRTRFKGISYTLKFAWTRGVLFSVYASNTRLRYFHWLFGRKNRIVTSKDLSRIR